MADRQIILFDWLKFKTNFQEAMVHVGIVTYDKCSLYNPLKHLRFMSVRNPKMGVTAGQNYMRK